MGCVLDSFAVLSYLYGQRGSARVERLLREARKSAHSTRLVLSVINLGEIYYIVARNEGFSQGDRAIALVKQWPVSVVGASEALTLSAARIKAAHPVSCADAFAVATALDQGAPILTGDPEFKRVEELVEIEWLK